MYRNVIGIVIGFLIRDSSELLLDSTTIPTPRKRNKKGKRKGGNKQRVKTKWERSKESSETGGRLNAVAYLLVCFWGEQARAILSCGRNSDRNSGYVYSRNSGFVEQVVEQMRPADVPFTFVAHYHSFQIFQI